MNNYREPNDAHEDEHDVGPTIEAWEEQNDLEDILYDEWRGNDD